MSILELIDLAGGNISQAFDVNGVQTTRIDLGIATIAALPPSTFEIRERRHSTSRSIRIPTDNAVIPKRSPSYMALICT